MSLPAPRFNDSEMSWSACAPLHMQATLEPMSELQTQLHRHNLGANFRPQNRPEEFNHAAKTAVFLP